MPAAERLLDERHVLDADAFVEILIWRVPKSVRGSAHRFKYSLSLIEYGLCTLRYDNEAGKGDHRHYDGVESEYVFSTPEKLLSDFWAAVDTRREI